MAKLKVQEQQKQPSKFKQAVANYRSQLEEAYSVGYNHGLQAREYIPDKVGAISAATSGFKKGVKDKKTLNKIEKRKGLPAFSEPPMQQSNKCWRKRK